MMNKVILTLAASAAALLASAPALADSTIVNLSAFDPSTPGNVPAPVTQTFGPGTYTVAVVGQKGGGLYDAWSVATPAATNWDERYSISFGSTTTQVNRLPTSGSRPRPMRWRRSRTSCPASR